jgi:hypothetical protein
MTHLPTTGARQLPTDWAPSPKQAALLNAAIRVGFDRNISAICRQAGVSRDLFYASMRQPEFAAAWERLPRDMLRTHMPAVVAAVVSKAKQGDLKAAAMLFDAFGLIGGASAVGQKVDISFNTVPVRRAADIDEFRVIAQVIDERLAAHKDAEKATVIDVKAP